jgi:lipoprotein-anchoring transpeptidase ErfK/SrfK
MAWQRARRIGVVVVLATVLLTLTALFPATSRAAWSPPNEVYVSQTGHTLQGGFLSYWRNNGAATFLGDPISEQITENGITVQYFAKARLELHPNQSGDNDVVLGRLGAEMLTAEGVDLTGASAAATATPQLLHYQDNIQPAINAFAPLAASPFGADGADHRFFAATGHTLNFAFKLAWEHDGGVDQFGYPLSEERQELSPVDGKVYTTQWFERARFEYHPETSNNYSVVITPLGAMMAKAHAVDTAAVAQGADVPNYDEALFTPPAPKPQPKAAPTGAKWIDVDLSRQYLTAYQGNTVIWSGYISSGRDGYDTPTGTFSIFEKLQTDDMTGGVKGTPEYYFQPAVPWVMYFAGGGYAIHGNYWNSNFGTQTSHGCVGVPVGSAEFLYDWTPLGTTVVIHY